MSSHQARADEAYVEYIAAVFNFEAVANPERVGECSDADIDAAAARLTVATNALHEAITGEGAAA